MGAERASSQGELCRRIPAELAGGRADEAVLRCWSDFSRREVKALFEAGRVRIDGRRVRKGERVAEGSELRVDAPSAPITADASLPLHVLFESPDFVIVDKPAGLPTAPLGRAETRSLAAALLARYPEMRDVGFRPREPGLVHRLDTETSGVVLAARHATAFAAARALFESETIEKRYLAAIEPGLAPSGEVEGWLGPDPGNPRRVLAYAAPPNAYAKRVRTAYRVTERGPRFWLVEVTVASAFRHQVRAHLAHLGYPIVGDAVYGGKNAPELGVRHALHGSYIAWAGDAEREGFRAEAALPAEMGALLVGGEGA